VEENMDGVVAGVDIVPNGVVVEGAENIDGATLVAGVEVAKNDGWVAATLGVPKEEPRVEFGCPKAPPPKLPKGVADGATERVDGAPVKLKEEVVAEVAGVVKEPKGEEVAPPKMDGVEVGRLNVDGAGWVAAGVEDNVPKGLAKEVEGFVTPNEVAPNGLAAGATVAGVVAPKGDGPPNGIWVEGAVVCPPKREVELEVVAVPKPPNVPPKGVLVVG
jgi:hypothetical protein